MKTLKQQSCVRSGCLEAVEFPGLVRAPPFLASKTSLAAAFDAQKRQVLSTSPVDNKCKPLCLSVKTESVSCADYPPTAIEFGFRRTGTVYASQRTTSFEQCFQLCRAESYRKSVVSTLFLLCFAMS